MITTRSTATRLCAGLLLAVALSACASVPSSGTFTPSETVAAPSSAAAPTAAASVVVGKGAEVNTPSCTHSSCAHITATTTGFPAAVTCAVAGPDGGTFGVQWQQNANETKESPNYYGFPKTTVTVTCTGGGRTASGSLTW